MDYIVVFVTCKDPVQARMISEALIDGRLAACANIVSNVESIFRWQGAVESGQETLLILKTRQKLFDQLCSCVKENHSYDVPEIIALPIISGDEVYLKWLKEESDQ
ncbi:MAG: divalent-cation tolerance protein CutA [Candidatus Omnitrophota bacterium]